MISLKKTVLYLATILDPIMMSSIIKAVMLITSNPRCWDVKPSMAFEGLVAEPSSAHILAISTIFVGSPYHQSLTSYKTTKK